jgi:hypothetical protein
MLLEIHTANDPQQGNSAFHALHHGALELPISKQRGGKIITASLYFNYDPLTVCILPDQVWSGATTQRWIEIAIEVV